MKPKVSIIIPFFNSESTLRRAIDSVISQSFSDWELILINDGSQDYSGPIAKFYMNDSRVALFRQENSGVSTARNFGASKAKGDWLLFLDSDDYLEKGSLSIIANQIIEDENKSFFIFGINRITSNRIVTQLPEEGKYYSKLAGTFIINRSVFENVGGYDFNLKFSENTELFHRIFLAGYSGKSVPKVILNYYNNPTGGSKNLQNMIDSLTIILEKHDDTLSHNVKHLYNQIIGVNYMRFRNFPQARKHIWKAVEYKPKKLATWGRLSLAYFPFLALWLYSETIYHA